jgi:hypothetical protein
MSFAAPESTEEAFAEVKLAPHKNAGSHLFLENASGWSLVVILCLLALFVVGHAWTAICAPPILLDKEDYYALNATEGNVTYDVDITYSQILPGHRFININGSLVPRDVTKDFTISVDVSVRTTFLKNSNTTSDDVMEARSGVKLVYTAGQNHTAFFPVTQVTTADFDTLQVRTSVETDFTTIQGFLFRCDYGNAAAETYERSSKLLMSFLIGSMLVAFALSLKFDAESFTQIFLLVIGVTGVFAGNPLSYFFTQGARPHISNHISMSVFQSIYRLFLFTELELLRSHINSPPTSFLIILGVFFAFYATVQAAAYYDRETLLVQAQREVPMIFQTEIALMIFDGIFALISLIYFVVAVVSNEGANPRRLCLIGISLFAILMAIMIAEVYFVLVNKCLYTTIPGLLVSSTHVMFAAISLFLLHTGGGRQYDAIADQGKAGGEKMNLDAQYEDDSDSSGEEEDADDNSPQ